MTPEQQLRKECETRLRALAENGEDVLAVGTADEFRRPSGDLSGQGEWRFLVVTTRRLLFADWSKPDAGINDIP